MAKQQKRPQGAAKADAAFNLRVPPPLLDSLRQFAAFHGRSANAELQSALEVHLVRSMFFALEDEAFVAELQAERPDFDLEAFRTETARHLSELEARSVQQPLNVVDLLP